MGVGDTSGFGSGGVKAVVMVDHSLNKLLHSVLSSAY